MKTRTYLAALSSLGCVVLFGMPVVSAQTLPREFKWDELSRQSALSAGTMAPGEPGRSSASVKIDNVRAQQLVAKVLTIDQPGIKKPRYRISGRVRYDGVDGVGFLEMWNYFPGGGQYFSRTLGDTGPMMKLTGTSGWRDFVLPFDATGAPPPTQLVVNVVLPGRGTVYLGPLRLEETEGAAAIPQSPDFQQLGRLLGIAGSMMGIIGAMVGILSSKGAARRVVMGALVLVVVFGLSAFATGVAAVVRSEPFAFSTPLLVTGFVACLVPLVALPRIRKRYEDIELRTMHAQDIARGDC